MLLLLFLFQFNAQAAPPASSIRLSRSFVSIAATNREERTKILELGVDIEETYSDRVWALVTPKQISKLENNHFRILSTAPQDVFFRAQSFVHFSSADSSSTSFPAGDELFHDYRQVQELLNQLHQENPELTAVSSLGKSIEGRDLVAIHINTTPADLASGMSSKPAAFFMGGHHAREHISVEVPLKLAQYLLQNKNDPKISLLLHSRDIWILPLVNPDGAEFDIEGKDYHYWRKNRRDAGEGEESFGVDLNRNYGYEWGTGGASADPEGETYRGSEAFSEPETKAIRDFIDARPNIKTLLTFHTFSELILYPWGYTGDVIAKTADQKTFEIMATTMAHWNHYTPEQSSALYITSGDTTDWAYGVHGIFAFTFELSPKDFKSGGFYPGENAIDAIFQDNLAPFLYLLDVSDAPHRVIDQGAGASIWYK